MKSKGLVKYGELSLRERTWLTGVKLTLRKYSTATLHIHTHTHESTLHHSFGSFLESAHLSVQWENLESSAGRSSLAAFYWELELQAASERHGDLAFRL